jgi:hypothetical protein
MAAKPELWLQGNDPYAAAQNTPTMGMPNPIEALINSLGGPSPTFNLTTYDNAASIGASNNQLATGLTNQSNSIFNLVQSMDLAANARAAEKARQMAAAEQAKQQAAIQAKLLEAQKKAALAALKTSTSGSNSSGGGGNSGNNYNLTPMPPLPTSNGVKPPKIPTLDNGGIHLPLARGKDGKPTRLTVAPPKKKPVRDPRKPGIQN